MSEVLVGNLSVKNAPVPEISGIQEILDDWHTRLQDGPTDTIGGNAISSITSGLARFRPAFSDTEWFEYVAPTCRRHKINELLQQDPYTARALEKPRGFAGDAPLLDFIYLGEAPPGTTALGNALLRGTSQSPSGRSVIDRRDRLSEALKLAGESRVGASALSIACGHLREAEALSQEELGRFSRIVALDQDTLALETIRSEKRRAPFVTVERSVKQILTGKVELGQHDLVYAAGLFDYLSDQVSAMLLKAMFAALSPGGRLIIGNFTPTNYGTPYMDVFMDWRLIYRSLADLRQLSRASISPREVRVERVYCDSLENIAYLDLTRA